MANLETNYVGLGLKNPIIVASAGITETVERMRKCQDNGAAAVVMKSYFEEEVSRKSPTPRFTVFRHDLGKAQSFTMMSYEQASEWDIERYAEEVGRAKAELEIKIIPSLNCITDDGWVESAKIVAAAGADAIELNTSCPHGSITFRGKAVEETIFHTVESVRNAVSVPIVAKLSPMLTSPMGVAKRLEEVGANGVTIFNRMTGLEVDIEDEVPVMHRGYAGHGGPWAIQYPLRWISQIRPELEIDIAGSGGVTQWPDVVKYLLVGANAVQTCSAVALEGYEVIRGFVDGLEAYMERKGYERLEDFRGKANSAILGTHEVDRRRRVTAAISTRVEAPCNAACPAGVPAQAYVQLIAQGKFPEALEAIRSKNPFQSVCGTVCYHPCEDECTRAGIDAPLAIRALKKFATEWGREHLPLSEQPVATSPSTGKRVAVVGAGPAGLSAAHDLALLGHGVTVFERLPVAGGMLVAGIPKYRLPRDLIQEEIQQIERLGVEIRLNTTFGQDVTLEGLREDGYNATLIALGAHKSMKLGVPGEDASGVVAAMDFLRDVNLNGSASIGGRVAVIGGGNSAIDSARCALRLGAEEIYLLYRRTKDEMPAHEIELRDAEDEGIRVFYLVKPLDILTNDGNVSGVRCVGGYLSTPGPDGRRTPVAVDAAEYVLPVDTVIVAIGQAPETDRLEGQLGLGKSGTIATVGETLATSAPGVFVAGDAATGPASVIEAIAQGKQAAAEIHQALGGQIECAQPSRVASKRAVLARAAEEPEATRIDPPLLDAAKRADSFDEIEATLTQEQAQLEAQRCLACGCGVGCGLCQRICIYDAVEKVGDRFVVDSEKCDGCGLCAARCRNEAISMVPIEA